MSDTMIPCCVADATHGPPPYFLTRNSVPVHRCRRCGTISADVSFDHEQYECETYYSMKFRSLEGIDRYWGMRWRHILGRIRDRGRPQRVLDVGAGNGYFVHLARTEFGMDAVGLEISAKEAAFAASVVHTDLRVEPLDRHPARDYDAITLFNVLEHVPDPSGFLAEAIGHLRPDGLVIVTTPNPACIQVRVKGLRRWGMIQPPHHIHLFTRASLGSLLARAGLKPIGYETLSTYMEWLWRYDSDRGHLRRVLFEFFRRTGLGADHLCIARRTAG